ncbi:MAG: hypothetical protein KAX55_11485 [Propionivibrio sp.]|nr:hypothetical protein [Propionivibrio sp.]
MKYRFIALLLLICANSAYSLEPFAPSEAELANLPPFCVRKLKNQMTPQEGAMYPSVHHYCFGLNFINRAARARDANSRSFNLTSAKGEINYTIRASPKDHWLLPQLYTDLGRTHLKLKEADQAIRAFSQALNVNNAYEPAYRGLIDSFRAAGSPSSVLDVARSGLRYFPDSKYLKKVYLDSGGKEPFPEPALKKETSPPVVKEGDSNVIADDENGQVRAEPPSSDPAVNQASESSDNANTERACRFCPPAEIEKRWRESFESGSVEQ